MRIVHIANFYGPKSGGIRTTLHELGAGYIQRGHQFVFIVPGEDLYLESTPSGTRITVPSFQIPFSGGYRVIIGTRLLKRLLVLLAPDRLESSDRFTLSKIGGWAHNRHIPSVVFSHESLSQLMKFYTGFSFTRFVAWHNRRLAQNFTYVIATTKFAGEDFRRIGIRNLIQVPLGVDLQTFMIPNSSTQLRHELAKGADVLLVHCGRMSPEKKPERSIEVLKQLCLNGINARLIYIGIGPMWKRLRKRSEGLPVTFLGYIADRKKVAAILAAADLSLAPGPMETFCLAALESLAVGTPVVASATSAVREFLALKSATPVGAIAENNTKSFTSAVLSELERISSEPTLAIACREQAEQFPWEATVDLMLYFHGERTPMFRTKSKLPIAS